jgi:hypothetical protein
VSEIYRDDDGFYHWKAQFLPVSAGIHYAVFTADGVSGVVVVFNVGESPTPPPLRGAPREQYERTYVLLPPTAGAEWAKAVVEARWESDRFTIGGSADDAGIGDLDDRRVIAVNPGEWQGETSLAEFFELYYPGVEFVAIEANTPQALAQKLSAQ